MHSLFDKLLVLPKKVSFQDQCLWHCLCEQFTNSSPPSLPPLSLQQRLKHRLQFAEEKTVLVTKDANVQNEDTFDIYDPRNPINKRRREEGVAEAKRMREETRREKNKK